MTGVRVHRRNSHDIAVMAIRQSGRGRATERWQDKSREVRGSRSAGKSPNDQRLGTMCVGARKPANSHNSL